MVRRLNWDWSVSHRKASPFSADDQEESTGWNVERPDSLRLTFDLPSLNRLPRHEDEAKALLFGLSNLDEIDALGTAPGPFPYLRIRKESLRDAWVEVIRDGTVASHHSMPTTKTPARDLAPQLADGHGGHPRVLETIPHYESALAHLGAGGHIFVTENSNLLNLDQSYQFARLNILGLTDACSILGIYLRSRDVYAYSAQHGFSATLEREGFYWVLARELLPRLWRYFSACVYAGDQRSDDTLYLGSSILQRASRSLQARDQVGRQFYGGADLEKMLYHFDYITLLLAGAVDSMARVSHRAYGLSGKEFSTRIRSSKHREALRSAGGTELADLLGSGKMESILTMLYEPRNTIHGAGMHGVRQGESGVVFEVPRSAAPTIWLAAESEGGSEIWGLSRDRSERTFIEPYTFSCQLIDRVFEAMNQMARATDVERLFQTRNQTHVLRDGPPDDGMFAPEIRESVRLLGASPQCHH